MGEALTYGIELAVGIATLAIGAAIWRSRSTRWLAIVFGVAGIAACAHALGRLVG